MAHRLFFALRPPRPVRDALSAAMGGVENARWQDDAQLHLTLRYIGKVDPHQADDLAEAASQLRFKPFTLELGGWGHFEKKGVPNSLWAQVKPAPGLLALRDKLERVCRQCGVAANTRQFTPHITVARLNTSSGSIGPFLARSNGAPLGQWRVEDYILYESFLREQGSLYEPVVTYPAANA